jgi:hypothetical protein
MADKINTMKEEGGDRRHMEYFEIDKDEDLLVDNLVQGIKEDKVIEDKETRLNSIKGLLLMVVAQIINTLSLVLLKIMYN